MAAQNCIIMPRKRRKQKSSSERWGSNSPFLTEAEAPSTIGRHEKAGSQVLRDTPGPVTDPLEACPPAHEMPPPLPTLVVDEVEYLRALPAEETKRRPAPHPVGVDGVAAFKWYELTARPRETGVPLPPEAEAGAPC